MSIWKTKLWKPWDVAFLKWASLGFGMIIGAYFPEFIMQYLWVIVTLVVLMSAKVIVAYFANEP